MSTEQSLDPSLIEQTKQQIRTLVNEIAQLAKSDLSPEEFHGEFLPRVVSALAAIGGAVWTIEDQGRLTLQYQINLQETRLRDSEEDQIRHGRLLQKVLASGEGMLVAPRSGAGDDTEAGNPTDFLLVLGPLKTELEMVGVIEVFQRPDAGPTTQKGYLRFLKQMCDLAGDFFKSRQLRHFGDRQILWTQLEEFTRGIHTNLDPRDTAYTIANEGRRLIECDRVSVAIRKGKRCRIEAVSGQDLFDKRSNTVRLLGRLATAVVASGETVWYTGDTSNMAPQVEDAVQEYVDESHSKTVAVIPLSRPQPELEEEDDPDKREAPRPPFAALIVEQIEDSRVLPRTVQRVQVVAQHSCTALANALEHDSLFLMPLWRSLGKTRWVVKARTLPKTISVAAAVLLVLGFLVFFPWPFKAQCNGTVEPVLRRDVFAKIDGDVKEVHVDNADVVKAGDLMVVLESVDLNMEIERIQGDLAEVAEQITTNRRILSGPTGNTQQDQLRWQQVASEFNELKEKQASLVQQLELCGEKKEQLKITAPIEGQVVTWDPEDLLMGRPVQRGQRLMRVNNPEGEWQLELLMPEKRMGHVRRKRAAIKAQDPSDDLKVEFVLATDPNTTFEGKVSEIHYQAEVRGDEGNTVMIKVAINREELPPAIRPGAGVSGKVVCDKMPVGYVFLCDAIAYFQKNIAFRFF
jgi:multidrug efflux pump subunit AcrA (membrane-fusion protein)